MLRVLESNRPKSGQVLVVNAKSNTERRAFHIWARKNGLKHSKFKTSIFDPTEMYRTNCGEKNCDCLCPSPWIYTINSTREYEEPFTEYVNTFNAVIIGPVLPALSKMEIGKREKPWHGSIDDEDLVDAIPVRKIVIMNVEDFAPEIFIGGKTYSRHQNK